MTAVIADTIGSVTPPARASQDYAEVLGATPVYRQVRVSAPEERCIEQRVADTSNDGSVAAGTILGGVAGGALGNAVGRGSGQALATVAGAVFGAVAGNRIASSSLPPSGERFAEQCQRIAAYRVENQIDGYDVAYRYQGRLYHARLRDDPGPRLPVRIDVQPAVY